jgi:hypothetical protein
MHPSSVVLRNKFSTLTVDVATTGRELRIWSFQSKSQMPHRHHESKVHISHAGDTAKYFVPAAAIRDFLPAEFRP